MRTIKYLQILFNMPKRRNPSKKTIILSNNPWLNLHLSTAQTSGNKTTKAKVSSSSPKEVVSSRTVLNKGLQFGDQQMLEWQMSQDSKRFYETRELHDLDNYFNTLAIEDNRIPEPTNISQSQYILNEPQQISPMYTVICQCIYCDNYFYATYFPWMYPYSTPTSPESSENFDPSEATFDPLVMRLDYLPFTSEDEIIDKDLNDRG